MGVVVEIADVDAENTPGVGLGTTWSKAQVC